MRDTELNRAFKYFADDVIEVMNGELDGKADLVDGKVPSTQLPSYVDDTAEGYYYDSKFYEDAQHTTEITGEAGKIYIDISSNKSYRWTGSVYTRIDECPAFGEIQGTVYEGNKGKANADAIAAMKDGQDIDSFGDVETALAGKANTSDLGAAASKGFDSSPTPGHTDYAVSSDGVYQAMTGKLDKIAHMFTNVEREIVIGNRIANFLSVVNYGNVGLFLCIYYPDESSARVFQIYKSSGFDAVLSITANGNAIKITPANSNIWYITDCGVV